mgnify:FL=1
MPKHSYWASGNTLVELSHLKWSLCVAELQRNNHFPRGYALGYDLNMKRLGAGISYYHAEKDNFYSSEATAEERANTRLTMELLIENEDRYKARAEYLLKNHLFQMRFGDDLVEYYINDGQVTFSIWQKGSNGFQNLVQTGLSRRKKDRIAILVDLFATSEARIISGL